jgi:hypothetical protein
VEIANKVNTNMTFQGKWKTNPAGIASILSVFLTYASINYEYPQKNLEILGVGT